MMTLDLSYQDAEYAAWTSWKPESPPDKRDAHAHGFDAGYEVGLAAREEPQCKTPGAVYHTEVGPERVSITVDLPKSMELDEDESRQLEAELHTAVEAVLAAAPSTELSLLRANKEVLVRRIIGLEEFARDVAAREDTERPDAICVEPVSADQLEVGDMVLAGDRPHVLVEDREMHYQGADPPTIWLGDFRDKGVVDGWGQVWRVVRGTEQEQNQVQ